MGCSRWMQALGGVLGLAASAAAQVTMTVDKLDSADGGTQPPAGVVSIDVFANVVSTDTWTAAGIACTALNGASFRYAGASLLNPGTADRFVCFVTKPLGRDVDARFTAGGAALAGRYSPTGPTAAMTASSFNVAWFASPPATSTSPSVDGYIARVSVDLPGSVPAALVQVGTTLPAGAVELVRCVGANADLGLVAATFDVPNVNGFNWYAYYMPSSGVTLTVDKLDAADGGTQPPAGVAVFDVLADVGSTDAWTAAGMACATLNGATFRYAVSGGVNQLLNPGTADRSVCFVSKPLARDVDGRFTAGGAAIAGRYSPTGSTAVATATALNLTWFASPPASVNTPSADGYIARVAINMPPSYSAAQVVVGSTLPTNAVALVQCLGSGSDQGLVSATLDVPAISGFNWYAYVPCSITFTRQPEARFICRQGDAAFVVQVASPQPVTYQWRRNGVALLNGPVFSGVNTPTLVITNATSSHIGLYSCLVTGAGGCSLASNSVALTMNTACCGPADVAGLGGTPGPNGTLTADDLIRFLSSFFAPNLAVADLVSLGGLPIPDGLLTADDLIYFLEQFFEGC